MKILGEFPDLEYLDAIENNPDVPVIIGLKGNTFVNLDYFIIFIILIL